MATPPLQPVVIRRTARFPDINKYRRDKVLGRGNFGKVCLAHSPSGHQYAIKEMVVRDRERSQTDRAIWEVRLTSQAGRGHPFIINYKEATVHHGVVYIVMEYAQGGNLKALISQYSSSHGCLPESLVRKYFVQLCLAVRTLHDSHIIHRDLKTENVFLDEHENVKLGDFGLARTVTYSQYAYTSAGTPGYIAPEIVMGHPYDYKADVWSLGCILYEMCTGRLPYHPSQRQAMIYQQHASISSSYSSDLSALVNQILDKSCHMRPSVAQILDTPYMRLALASDLTAEQAACFDSSGRFVHRLDAAAHTHADDIQSQLVGAIRAIDFADVSHDGARSPTTLTDESGLSEQATESDSDAANPAALAPSAAIAIAPAEGRQRATDTEAMAQKIASLKKQFEVMCGDGGASAAAAAPALASAATATASAASGTVVSSSVASASAAGSVASSSTYFSTSSGGASKSGTSVVEYSYIDPGPVSSIGGGWKMLDTAPSRTSYWPSTAMSAPPSSFGGSVVGGMSSAPFAPSFRPGYGAPFDARSGFYF